MRNPIPINLAVEDALSEAVVRKLLGRPKRHFAVGICYSQGGFGYLKRSIRGFNNAARGTPFFVLTDLDQAECPPVLINDWLPVPRNHNLQFRVAVREVEAWLLADRESFASYLRIPEEHIPPDVEAVADPKMLLVRLAARSPSRDLRIDLVPPAGSTRKQGPNYNGRLIAYVNQAWRPSIASLNSTSLSRTIRAIRRFRPIWQIN